MSGSIILSAAAFSYAWHACNLREPHTAINVPTVGSSPEEAIDIYENVLRELTEKQLLDSDGNIVWELVERLCALANWRTAVDIWFVSDELIFTALAATWGYGAQLAIWQEGDVYLIHAEPDSLVESVMSTIGDAEAGTGETVSIPTRLLWTASSKAAGNLRLIQRTLEIFGIGHELAWNVANIHYGLTARIEFGIQHRDNEGNPGDRSQLEVFDTHRGRYIQSQETRDDIAWTMMQPTSNEHISMQLREKLGV